MDDFRKGADYVLNCIERHMYYIPFKWREKDDAGAIYNMISNVIKDLRVELDIEEVSDNGE